MSDTFLLKIPKGLQDVYNKGNPSCKDAGKIWGFHANKRTEFLSQTLIF